MPAMFYCTVRTVPEDPILNQVLPRGVASVTHGCSWTSPQPHPYAWLFKKNPRDREACWAAIYGVSQSRTRLKRLSTTETAPHPLPTGTPTRAARVSEQDPVSLSVSLSH